MASDRLRRTPIGKTTDPLDHRSGMPTTGHSLHVPTYPSPQGEVGLQGGESTSSTPGAGPGTAISGNYRDEASQPKGTGAPAHPGGPPFTLTK